MTLIYVIFICCAALGLILTFIKFNYKIKAIGKGLLWASITNIILTTLFLVWLNSNFPK